MGVGLRIFIVDDDNSLKRLPLKTYEGLMKRDPDISFPQYAGKRVRYVEVVIEFENRKPVNALHMQYFIMHFDSKGRIEAAVENGLISLGANLVPMVNFEKDSVVIDAQHLFAKKRFDHQFRWMPTSEIKTAVLKTIFKPERPTLK